MCVCNLTLLCQVCTHYGVVMFQLQTVTPLNLGFVDIVTTLNLALLPHLFLPFFWIILFPPPLYCPPINSLHLHIPLSVLHLLPTSSPGAKHCPPGRFLYPPPASLRRLYLRPAPQAYVCRRFPWLCTPPFATLGLRPGPFHTLGGLSVTGPSVSPVPLYRSPWVLLGFLASSGSLSIYWVDFRARARGQGASTPWHSIDLVPAPPTNWPFRCRSGSLAPPPPLTTLPSPFVVLIPSLLVEGVGV